MKNSVLNLQNQMVEAIIQMEERNQLRALEEAMESNIESIRKISLFQKALDEYNYNLNHFSKDADITKYSQKLLYTAKLEMDQDSHVKAYNDCLKKCNEPLQYLQYKLFHLFYFKGDHSC